MSSIHQLNVLNYLKKKPINDVPSFGNQFMGGTHRLNQPSISGHVYILIFPPEDIFRNFAGISQKILFSTIENYTPSSRQITKGEIPGFGGVKKYVVLSQSISGTFSVTFTEFQNHILFQIFRLWTSSLQSNFGNMSMKNTVPKNYKGMAIIYDMKPTMTNQSTNEYTELDIENITVYDGIFPETDSEEAFSFDVSSNEKISLPISFSFDGAPIFKDSLSINKMLAYLNDALL